MMSFRLTGWLVLASSCVLFSAGACGGGSDGTGSSGSASIGPAGGTVTSPDGKISLTIPPGALTQTIDVSLAKADETKTNDPDLVAGTAYQLNTPAVTLAKPAVMKVDLHDSILTHAQTGLHVAAATVVGTCDASTPTCYVVLGSGPCPADHDKLTGLVNLTTANGAPIDPVWTERCDLSDPPQPLLATLEPSTVLGGAYDASTFTLSTGLAQLNPAIFATVDTTLYLDITGGELAAPIDGTSFGQPNEQASSITVTPSRPAAIATYKYFFDSGFGIAKNGAPIDTLQVPGTFLGENTTGTFSQKFGGIVQPGATYAYLFVQAIAYDAAGNELAGRIQIVPVTYGTQLQAVLVADPISITAPGSSTLVASVPTALLGTGIQKMEFFEGATKIGESTTPRYQISVPYTQANNGMHTYTAKVTDQQNRTAVSNPVTVTVAINVAPTFDLYVDPVNGLDTNPGTLAQPFKTLTHMATLATSGQKIGLLDGMYLEGATLGTCDGRGVNVPGGLTLQAVHPRAAVIANIALGNSTGSMTLVDLKLDGGATSGGCTGVTSSSTSVGATLTMVGLQFDNGAHVVLSGSVQASLSLGSLTGNWNSGPHYSLASAAGSSQLTIHGGTFDGGAVTSQCGMPAFTTASTATIVFDGVTVSNFAGSVFSDGGGTSILQNNTVFDTDAYASGCGSVVTMGQNAGLTIDNSTIKNSTSGNAIDVRGGNETVTLSAATITGNVRAIFHNNNFGDTTASITIANSTLSNNTAEAISWTTSLNPGLTLSVRNSQIMGNAVGFYIYAGTGSSIDLGTAASLGGNAIQNTGLGLHLDGATVITANAAGNTWTPSGQGADAAGHYATAAVVGPIAAGTNYQIGNGSTIQF